jgi:Phosphate-selective porin O and P
MRGGLAGVACVAGLFVAGPLAAQAKGVTVRLTGRLQFQFNTTSVSEADTDGEPGSIAGSTFETRRVRVAAHIDIDDWISGVIEPDYALGRLQVRQAWMNLAFDPRFEMRFGQFKKPFSLVLLTSSLESAMIERGAKIRNLNEAYAVADAAASERVLATFENTVLLGEEQELLEAFGYMSYDLGVGAHGKLGAVDYDVGLFNGTGADRRDDNDGKSYVGRLRWHASTGIPFAIGAAASHHEMSPGSALGSNDGTAFEVDVEVGAFRRQGVHVIAEAVAGDNLAVSETFLAAQGVVSYFHPVSGVHIDGFEPLGRVSWGDPDREIDGDEGVLLTPGFNIYLSGRNRLQFNWDVFVPSGDRFETKHALRAQAQLAF